MYSIHPVSFDAIPVIRELTFQVWPQTYRNILSAEQIDYMLEMMYSEASLKKQISDGAQFLIIKEDQTPVGFASYQEIRPTVFKLHKIYILPSRQGKGTGKLVMDFVLDDVVGKGATALQLQVNKNNKAKLFYEKLGFKEIDKVKLDIGNGYIMDDFIMQKSL